jgi:hypothetical protein
MKAYNLIASEKQFCRGNFAVESDSINSTYTYPGFNPETNGCKAVKWDLQGALIHCYDDTKESAALIELAKQHLKTRNVNVGITGRGKVYTNLAEFSDMAPHKDVVEFLTKLEEEYETNRKIA